MRPSFSSALPILLLGLLLCLPGSLRASGIKPLGLPEPPAPSDKELQLRAAWQWVAPPTSVYLFHGDRESAPLGVGRLKLLGEGENYYDWPAKILLPVWDRPGGALRAWVRNGQVVPVDGSAASPLSGAGMVETDYEQLSFIVLAVDEEGWLQIRLRPGVEVWTHPDFLQLGVARLSYQPWLELLREHGDWLSFRSRVPHNLRSEPSATSQAVTRIGLDHKLELLEVQGDWMRVRVTQPDLTCSGPDRVFNGTIDEGWVKWRDADSGPWLWFYTRGC